MILNKFLSVITILFFFILTSCSINNSNDALQNCYNAINNKDKYDKHTSLITIRYPNGAPACTIELQQGLTIVYYSNGKIKEQYIVKDNYPNGEYKSYYPSGKIQTVHNFIFGVKDGILYSYNEEGYLENAINFVDGIVHGSAKFYFPNGDVKAELRYLGGKKMESHYFLIKMEH